MIRGRDKDENARASSLSVPLGLIMVDHEAAEDGVALVPMFVGIPSSR